MADTIKVKIITPKHIVFDGVATSVTIPAEMGEMQVLNGHISVVSRLKLGKIIVSKAPSPPEEFEVEGGFFRVTSEQVNILADRIINNK